MWLDTGVPRATLSVDDMACPWTLWTPWTCWTCEPSWTCPCPPWPCSPCPLSLRVFPQDGCGTCATCATPWPSAWPESWLAVSCGCPEGIAPQRAIWTLDISRHILSTTMSGINSISHNFDAWCLNLSELSFPHCVVAFKHRCSSAQDWHPCLCPLLLGSFQMIKFQLSPPAFGAVCRTDRTRSKADSCGACQNAPKNMRGPWLSHVRKPTSQDCTTAYCCYSFYNNEHYRNPCPEWLSGLPA